MPARIWRVGLVGTGYWSENHLRAWQSLPNVVIAALCDLDPQRLGDKAQRYGVPEARRFTDFAAMLAGADIDIVDIVTGSETHRALTETAAKAGKHILCQKPLAPTLEEAEAMARVCRDAGVRLMVAENWRWMPPFQRIRRALDMGAAGAIRMVRYRHKAWYTPRMTPDADLPQPFLREIPRLLFFEMGVHWLDTWRFLFGTPHHLFAEMRRVSPHVAGEDTGVVVLSHDGFSGFLDMSWASREDRDDSAAGETGIRAGFVEEMVIEGDRGTLLLSSTGRRRAGTLTLRRDDGSETILADGLRFDNAAAHLPLQAHFLECLETGAPFQTSADDNLTTLRMALAAYESAANRRVVPL